MLDGFQRGNRVIFIAVAVMVGLAAVVSVVGIPVISPVEEVKVKVKVEEAEKA